MAAIPFDTLKFSKALRNANVPQEQAEGMAQAFADAIGDEIVTKSFLDARLEALKSELLKYMIGQTLVTIGVVVTLLRYGH